MRYRRSRHGAAKRLAIVSLLVGLTACSPALDWREARPAGGDLTMLFPCRPEPDERMVRMADKAVPMHMHSCRAAGLTFSLVFAELTGPAQVTGALEAWRAAAIANVAGSADVQPRRQAGATPNEHSARLRIEGRLPDGRRVVEQAVFFVKGLTLYQASVLGDAVPAEPADTFFGAIRLRP